MHAQEIQSKNTVSPPFFTALEPVELVFEIIKGRLATKNGKLKLDFGKQSRKDAVASEADSLTASTLVGGWMCFVIEAKKGVSYL